MDEQSLSMLCDFYEFTMAGGFMQAGISDRAACFDVFFRSVPDGGGFAIAAGLEQIIDYIKSLRFSPRDIDFLKCKRIFKKEFLDYLAGFRFSGDICAVPEGTPVFPGEPILTVKAPIAEAQLIETYILLTLNHQSLIATKASRIVRAACGRRVIELGARRAHGASAALLGARAAFIGGCSATSCALSDMLYSVPCAGTAAHSWVQMFDSELEAFVALCEAYPESAVLPADTYDVLNSGVPNAIKAFKRVLEPKGIRRAAIRLDSGDIARLSSQARRMLDDAGLYECKIVASNSLDEYIIRSLLEQNAKVDIFGVGERLITAASSPVFGCVYKLAAVESNGRLIPKIKISENISKITNPHYKNLFRLFDNKTGKAAADLMTVYDEAPSADKPLRIYSERLLHNVKTIENFTLKPLLTPIFVNGELVYRRPDLKSVQSYCRAQTELLPGELLRFENPGSYCAGLSEKLWGIKQKLLTENRGGV